MIKILLSTLVILFLTPQPIVNRPQTQTATQDWLPIVLENKKRSVEHKVEIVEPAPVQELKPKAKPQVKQDCPPGSYSIGEVCKQEPTGCPYGDSIPVDSFKCAPPENY